MRDILDYSTRDTSLLIGITHAQVEKLLSFARKRVDMTEGPSSLEIEAPEGTIQVEVCQSPSEITTKRNYSSIAGDLVSGAIANAYHPRRIVGLVSYSRIFAIDIGANIGESVPQEVVSKD